MRRRNRHLRTQASFREISLRLRMRSGGPGLIVMPERRSNSRKKVLLEAKWASMSRRHEARVDDVSLGGCFVNTFGHVELQEPVELQILLPSGEWLKLNGTVASYHPGVGSG